MTITISALLSVCAGFSAICVAVGYLVKIYKTAKKPIDALDDRLAYYDECLKRDKKDIARLNSIAENNTKCLQLLLESTLAILGHLEDGNHTKMLAEKKSKIESYLTKQI